MSNANHVRYANTHEWAKVEDGIVITGISHHAQDALGDIVHVECPQIGQHLNVGDVAGAVESVKTASDIHAPISGTVIEINPLLEDEPEIINEDPYDKGWIYKLKADNIDDVEQLLPVADYEATL